MDQEIKWVGICVALFFLWQCDSDRDKHENEAKQNERESFLKAGYHPEYHWYGTRWIKP